MKYQLSIPKPCHENWAKMSPVQKGKFCKSCNKEVIDFTKLTDAKITSIVSGSKNVCGRFKNTQLEREIETPQNKNLSKVAASFALISMISGAEPMFSQGKVNKVESHHFKKVNPTIEAVFLDKEVKTDSILIKGTIKDITGPLPGAAIILKGTTIGVETDFDGNFSIEIPNKKRKSHILVVSFIGLKTQEIDILSIKKPLVILMEEDDSILGEVVTVGMIAVAEKPNFFQRCLNIFRSKEHKRY
ncbi:MULTISPECIES: carboxypeptidase-like regulatory domain-containing protein [Tenacibaculum]|uniref:carboxypeptidase-like regulatory domain-containing protein n=1 Tax=Tenacibaculum TaxID=104267 RepID=UPI001F0AED2D|nr:MULTISPECIES: carboxypeptidase-like regulatory domain-containing protein [Tenacibaculum]MCH3880750.1 carboxypeptidase-like regulatory domain-containing protein [Tenacibaculum aquimarinum]MDO6599651.1 carboxypeptidase-like regulatory domain-containing protein [Tenacibaculum sp. 1_MG-2023]